MVNDYLRSDFVSPRIIEMVATNFTQRVCSGQIFQPLDLKANRLQSEVPHNCLSVKGSSLLQFNK